MDSSFSKKKSNYIFFFLFSSVLKILFYNIAIEHGSSSIIL